jgi:prepilin-type N-terminal cleavage/methylation domain-containing protein
MLSMSRKMTTAFTALELLVVIIIIGILATLSLPNLRKMKEKSYDNEAKATLKLIQAAEKIYYMQNGFYYPPSGTTTHSLLNNNLKVFLPTSGHLNWNYSATAGTGAATASRAPSGRRWSIAITEEEATCTSVGGDTCIP